MATTAELQAYAADAARRHGVPVAMFLWQIGQESQWDPNARNKTPGSTATGLGQFIKGTAEWFGIDPTDPYQSLEAAAKYDAMLYKQTGDWEKALTAYGTLNNASPQVLNAFRASLEGSMENEGVIDKIMGGLKSVWDNSMGGLAQDTYKNLTGQGDQTSGKWDFAKMITGNIGFVVLGIVVIALAVLSNNTVRSAATKAVLKK